MPKIFITNCNTEIEVLPVRSLLVSLQMNEIPIQTICGGRAVCGKCAIKIVKGKKFTNPKPPHEVKRLETLQASPDTRLACQTYPGKDLVIEISNYGNVSKEKS